MLAKLEKILLFLTVFLLPTQLGRHFWPDFSFIYSLPVDYLSPTLYFWDLLALSLWGIFILQKRAINKLALNLFYFFLLSQSLSLFFASNIGAGLVRLEQYTMAGLFGVYIASAKFSETKSIIVSGLSVAVLMESILAVAQFIKGGTLGFWILGERTFSITTPGIAKFNFYGYETLRPYGSFPHPNVLAAFMVVVLPLLSNKWIILIGGITALLTVSRTAILVGLAESLALLKKWRKLLLIGLLILSPIILTRFSALLNYDSLTFIRREELIAMSWKIFTSHPILGIGLNNFIPVSSDGVIAGPSRFLQPVHNIFLLEMAETGLVGLAGYLALISYPIWKGPRIIWATIIFLGLFDHYFLTLPQGYRLLFLIWGLSFMLESDGGEYQKNL